MRFAILFVVFLGVQVTGLSKTINVPGDHSTIQAAINAASEGDTILVHPGTYTENINFNGKDIIVGSLFLTTGDVGYVSQTTIDGNANGYVVTFDAGESADALLTGFTLTNGLVDEAGGLFCRNASPRLTNLIIKENSSNYGRGTI